MSELQMHDSGERREFSTGAVRDRAAQKPRPDLISPIFESILGEWLGLAARPVAAGGKGYGPHNWEKGMPLSDFYASLKRHLNQWARGELDEPHMVAVACNAMFIIHTTEMIRRGVLPAELADMPDYLPEGDGRLGAGGGGYGDGYVDGFYRRMLPEGLAEEILPKLKELST